MCWCGFSSPTTEVRPPRLVRFSNRMSTPTIHFTSLCIADVVLAELVWALDRSYRRPRSDIVAVLRALAGNATVLLEAAASMRSAIALYEKGPADFVDCLLAVKAQTLGCEALRSFDRKMKGLPGVVPP